MISILIKLKGGGEGFKKKKSCFSVTESVYPSKLVILEMKVATDGVWTISAERNQICQDQEENSLGAKANY